jgi:hypothetical protein
MLEDKHIQLCDVDNSLFNYDLILRVNDNKTKYIAFDLFDYSNQEIVSTTKIESENNNE